MGTHWPIGDRAGALRDDIDSARRRLGWLQPVPYRRRLCQDGRQRSHRLDRRGPGQPAGADRERSGLCPQRRLRRADQGDQGFQPALGEPGDRRAGFGHAAGPGLFLGGAHLPRFSGKLCQWPGRKLAAGCGLPDRPRPLGNSYAEAVEKRLNGGSRCKNATKTPDDSRGGRTARNSIRFSLRRRDGCATPMRSWGCRGRGGPGTPFEFDAGGIALDLDLSVAMTVTLEEAVNGAEKRVRLPTGKELNVKIPAGGTAGQQRGLEGQGDTAQGHPPGDLLIPAGTAPHPFFRVDGSYLRVALPITLYEAVLGGKVRVPTLTSAVELSIPKNTSSGRTFRLKGKGLPEAGVTGDLYVTTRIILPDGNDAELEALMQKWRDGHPYNPRSDLG